MNAVTPTAVANASAASPGTVQGVAAVLVLRKALDLQESCAAELIQALPQQALATSGAVGTQVNTYA